MGQVMYHATAQWRGNMSNVRFLVSGPGAALPKRENRLRIGAVP